MCVVLLIQIDLRSLQHLLAVLEAMQNRDVPFQMLWSRWRKTHAGRLVYDGGHPAYNAYVRDRLDACDDAGDVHALVDELHARLRATRSDLPWR